MAFLRNYSNETVSSNVLEGKGQGQKDDRIHNMVNEVVDLASSDKEFDMNVDPQYESEGEQDDADRLQTDAAANDGIGLTENNLQPSGRRTAAAGKWGTTFWKDCQPIVPRAGSGSGQDSKSGSDHKIAEGFEGNSSDVGEARLDSEEDDGNKSLGKGQRGHPDVPAEEMLSDEYYEQDGEEQSDSVQYKRFNHSVVSNSRSQSKPHPDNNYMSRNSRASNDTDDDDEGDTEYEEEDEVDEDDPDDVDFDPDDTVVRPANKAKDWDGEDSDGRRRCFKSPVSS